MNTEKINPPFKMIKNFEDILVNGEICESYSISELSYVDDVPLDFSSHNQYQMEKIEEPNLPKVSLINKTECTNGYQNCYDENIILDLSIPTEHQERKDNTDKAKFNEISTKICDELAKLI